MTPETPISQEPIANEGEEKAPKATVAKAAENGSGHLASRAEFLNLIGDLREDTVDVFSSAGKKITVLVTELTGEARADLIKIQAEAYQRGSLDLVNYERKMLMAGVADPESPKGARQPLLKAGDADMIMGMGASSVRAIVEAIEGLSAMGANAQVAAEGNSETTLSVGSTSG